MKKAHTVTTAAATAKATTTTTTTTTAKTTTIIYLPPFCDSCKHVPAPPTTKPTKPATTTTTTRVVTATATRAKTSAIGSSSSSSGSNNTGDGDSDCSSDSGNVTTMMTTTRSVATTLRMMKTMANGSGSGNECNCECDYGSCCQRRWQHKNYDKHATSTLTPTTKPTTTTTTTLPVSTTETETAMATAAALATTNMAALRRPAAATSSSFTLESKDTQEEENKITQNTSRFAGNEGVADTDGGADDADADANEIACSRSSRSIVGTHWNLQRLQQNEANEIDEEQVEVEEIEKVKEEQGIIVKQRIAMDTDTQSKKACSNSSNSNSNNISRPSDLRHQQQQKHRTANNVNVNVNETDVDVDVVYNDNEVRKKQVEKAKIEVADNGAVDVSILADSIKLRNTKLVMPIEEGVVVEATPAAVGLMMAAAATAAVRTTAECRLENVTTMRNTSSSAVEIASVEEELTAAMTVVMAAATTAATATATETTRPSYASLTQNNATAAKAPTAEKTKTETATNTNTNTNRNTTKATTEMATTLTKDSQTTITTLHDDDNDDDDECRCFKYNGDISMLEGVSRNVVAVYEREFCSCSCSYTCCACYCEMKIQKKKKKVEQKQHLTKSEAESALKQQQQQQQGAQDYLMTSKLVEESSSSLASLKEAQAQAVDHEGNERKLARLNSSRSRSRSRSNSSSRSITLLKFWQQLVHKSEATIEAAAAAAAWNWNWYCYGSRSNICATVSENATTMMKATAAPTTTTTTTTKSKTTATATTITSVKNAAATFTTRAKTMPAITKTTTAATKSWLSLLMMLMLTTTANCWGGRQDAPTNCTFPARWEGSWFLSGYQQSIHIKGSQFSYRGRCAASDGNKYLIVDEKGCHRCLVIYEKHKNVLQYKESECEGDSMYMHQSNPSALAIRSSLKQTSDHRGGAHPNTNGHSRLSSSDQYIMRSNDDMNDYFCKGRETLQNLCDQIPGDALLYSLFRESAEPVKCPLKGPFIFTYNRGHGECKSPVSNIESCTEDSRLLLSFQACPDVQGTESTVEELTCLATWKDGNSRYLVGLVSHHHAISNEERYRCFVYEKISSLMGGPSMLSSKDAEYKLAQSGDATCNGLDSAEVGSRIMSLRKPPLAERCDFPVWFKGPRHWHALMGNAIYNYHSNDGSVHIIKSNGYMETRALCEQINKQTATEMMAVVHYTTGCQSGFMCMMFYRRDTHVIEIQTGKPAIRLEDACAPEYFDINKMAYITLLATNPDPQICPMEGLYNLRGAIGPPYLTTRHKRNHNNKVHLGHGHHHQHDTDTGNNGFGHKRHSTLSFRNAERIDKGSWHANTRGLPVRSRRDANELTFVKQTNSTKEILLSATATPNETSVGFVTRSRRDVPGCVTNYKAQRQLWIGCTEANVIDVRPLCNVDGEEEYSCHGSWSENATFYIIARHKSTKHAVCISYQPTEGTAAKLVIGDACYRGTQKPPDHHLVANLSVFGKCGDTGSYATRIQIGNWLMNAALAFIALLLGSQQFS